MQYSWGVPQPLIVGSVQDAMQGVALSLQYPGVLWPLPWLPPSPPTVSKTMRRMMITAMPAMTPVWKSKIYGAFVLNRRVVLHAIDATPARWRGDAGSSPLDRARTAASSPRNDLVKNCRVHPTHRLFPHSSQPRIRARECLEI